MPEEKDRRAFQTDACGVTCIVFHHSAGKARSSTYRSARDAGYQVGFSDIRVRRRPDLDGRMTDDVGIPLTGACLDPNRFSSHGGSKGEEKGQESGNAGERGT